MITAPSIENHLTAGSQNITTLSFAFQNKVLIWNIGLWDTDKKNIKKRDISTEKNQKFDQRTKRDHGDKWTDINYMYSSNCY